MVITRDHPPSILIILDESDAAPGHPSVLRLALAELWQAGPPNQKLARWDDFRNWLGWAYGPRMLQPDLD